MSGEMNLWQIMLDTGPVVKFVLVLLVLASVLSWAIIVKKKKEYKKIEQNNKRFQQLYLSTPLLEEVWDKSQDLPFSPFKEVFENGYKEYLLLRDQDMDIKIAVTQLERALKRGWNNVQLNLESSITTLASIGSVSPYIGLLGTVWGIINSFTGLASGGATLEKVAPGIAEALVATAIGLFAAIPAVLFYNHFSKNSENWNLLLDSFEQDFINRVERDMLESHRS